MKTRKPLQKAVSSPRRPPSGVHPRRAGLFKRRIRQAAKTGQYRTRGEKHVLEGSRLWHEGDYRHGTQSLASFYPFLSCDTILEKEILTQSKRLLFGYRYEVRFSLTKEGEAITSSLPRRWQRKASG